MTPPRSAAFDHSSAEIDLGETRSRFLFARAQTRAHALTSDYVQFRESGFGESAATAQTRARPRATAA
jgi:hypothetical protein